eukprot:9673740-Karenia_brevis.AAC.1
MMMMMMMMRMLMMTMTMMAMMIEGHKLQWYKGILYCITCGGWTMTQGNPRKLVDTCKGRGPMGTRILRAVA